MSRQRHRPQGFQRTDRVADFIQRELADLIRTEMKDPRIGMVTIQHVDVTRDLAHAKVYFTLLGENRDSAAAAEKVLAGASGFLRSALAKRLNTRTTPQLHFHYDLLPEEAARMDKVITRARRQDAQRQQADTDSEE